MLAMKQTKEWSNGNNLEENRIKNRGATRYCMHCGYKDGLHDPNCPIVREKSHVFPVLILRGCRASFRQLCC